MHILHMVLHTAAYYLTYSAFFAYCNMQNMQNMNPALLHVLLHIVHIVLHTAAYYLTYSAYFAHSDMQDLKPALLFCILMDILFGILFILFCIYMHQYAK
jgi:hypothetical protein